jgi:hypothetical protein
MQLIMIRNLLDSATLNKTCQKINESTRSPATLETRLCKGCGTIDAAYRSFDFCMKSRVYHADGFLLKMIICTAQKHQPTPKRIKSAVRSVALLLMLIY